MKRLLFFFFISSTCFSQTIEKISDLALHPMTQPLTNEETSINVLGFANRNDGGGGLFYLEETSISGAPDEYMVYVSNVSNKSWVRIIPDNKINVKWFGAKGDGDVNDASTNNIAISEARNFIRVNKGYTLFFPQGDYYITSIFIGDSTGADPTEDEGLRILGSGKSTKIIGNSEYPIPVFRIFTDNITISDISLTTIANPTGISVEKEASKIVLNNIYFSNGFNNSAIYFIGCEGQGNTCISEGIKILNCEFENITGYQISQKINSSTNNVLIRGNISTDCNKDFIEINNTGTNPSRNWVISNNIVRNINGNSTEGRFIGITATDGVIISNNLFEKCTGDSAFHFEKVSGDIIIANNIVRDPKGVGALITNYDNDDNNQINRTERHINFSNNLVEFTESFSGNIDYGLFFSVHSDETVFNIVNNKFINNSQEDLLVLQKSDTNTMWNFNGNEVTGFNSVIAIGQNAGHINFNNNTLRNCDTGISLKSPKYPQGGGPPVGHTISTLNENTLNINNNVFQNVEDVFKSDEGKINLLSMSNNVFDDSNLKFDLDVSFLNSFKTNRFKNGSTTNYRDTQITIDVQNGSGTNLFSIKKENYTYLCWVEIQANSGFTDRTRHLLRVSRNLIVQPSVYNNHYAILDQTRNGNYPLPNFFVNEDGLNATITGSNGVNFKAKVSIIDINGLQIIDEESLGSVPAVQSSTTASKALETDEPTSFDNSVSYDVLAELYPNPVEDEFTVEVEKTDNIDSVYIYDLNGRLIKTVHNIKSKDSINVSNLESGTYLVIIHYGNKKELKKLVKK